MEFFGRACLKQTRAHWFAPYQPRNPTQDFHVGARLGLRRGEQKEETNRFSVERFVGDRGRGRPRYNLKRCDRGRLAVRDRYSVPDACRELPFALQDGGQDLLRERPPAVAREHQLDKLAKDPLLVLGLEGYPDAARSENVRQAHDRSQVS